MQQGVQYWELLANNVAPVSTGFKRLHINVIQLRLQKGKTVGDFSFIYLTFVILCAIVHICHMLLPTKVSKHPNDFIPALRE